VGVITQGGNSSSLSSIHPRQVGADTWGVHLLHTAERPLARLGSCRSHWPWRHRRTGTGVWAWRDAQKRMLVLAVCLLLSKEA